MKETTLIKNASIINEGKTFLGDILIENGLITKIGSIEPETGFYIIDGTGKHLFPGIIDCQVHFREPGLTHKGDLYTESKAAIAGGVTSFIDMPNTIPNVLTTELLADKYSIASKKSFANYAFFLGVNGDNIAEITRTDTSNFIGVSDD